MGTLALTLLALCLISFSVAEKLVVCNYEAKSHLREGQGKFDVSNLDDALRLCTHLLYGYAAIDETTFKLVPLNEQFDVIKDNYRHVTDLKTRFPKLKVFLSVGGNEDISGSGDARNEKYRKILESTAHRLSFANSAYTLLKAYNFDGLDLAWEFPETKPKKIKTGIKKIWGSIKSTFTGEHVVDDNTQAHREQFVALAKELKNAFRGDLRESLQLSLTVLPNVNSTVYYDARGLAPYFDFIVLHAFDFYTPERNDKLADFPSPLYELIDRRGDENIDAWVKSWLNNGFPANKLILGIPTYGRSWHLAGQAKVDEFPITDLDGPGDPGPLTKEAGLLSYPEICNKVTARTTTPGGLTKIPDATKRRGVFAYRYPDKDNKGGVWVGYEDPETAANKAQYAKAKGLAGIAVDDLTLDDFRGVCGNNKYGILKSAVAVLN